MMFAGGAGVAVLVGVTVLVGVAVLVGALVGVSVGVAVSSGVLVAVAGLVGVAVFSGVLVAVVVLVGVVVGLAVAVVAGVGVQSLGFFGVAVAVGRRPFGGRITHGLPTAMIGFRYTLVDAACSRMGGANSPGSASASRAAKATCLGWCIAVLLFSCAILSAL